MTQRVGEGDRDAVGGVSPVGGDGARPVLVADLSQPLSDSTRGSVPLDAFQPPGTASHRVEQALGTVHVGGDVHSLDAHVPLRDGMVGVRADFDETAHKKMEREAIELNRQNRINYWKFEKLPKIFEDITKVNRNVARKFKAVVQKDAVLNAVMILNSKVDFMSLCFDEAILKQIERDFKSYMV